MLCRAKLSQTHTPILGKELFRFPCCAAWICLSIFRLKPAWVVVVPFLLAPKAVFASVPAQSTEAVNPYPPGALRPVRPEGTLAFLLLMAGVGLVVLMGWYAWRRRANSRPGLPDEPLFPPASPHRQIHDRKYLSRILSDDVPPPP